MGYVLIGLGSVLVLVAAICQILVLVKLFQTEGVGMGILGFFCNIYLLIWGFMNAGKLDLMKLMMGWLIGGIVGGVLIGIGASIESVSMTTMP